MDRRLVLRPPAMRVLRAAMEPRRPVTRRRPILQLLRDAEPVRQVWLERLERPRAVGVGREHVEVPGLARAVRAGERVREEGVAVGGRGEHREPGQLLDGWGHELVGSFQRRGRARHAGERIPPERGDAVVHGDLETRPLGGELVPLELALQESIRHVTHLVSGSLGGPRCFVLGMQNQTCYANLPAAYALVMFTESQLESLFERCF